MQICNDKNTCDAHPDDGHFQSCFGICNAGNRIRISICNAGVLANLHYATSCNLSCVASKTPGSVLQRSQRNYGVGTFLRRIPPAVLLLSCKDDPDVHLENEKLEQQRVQAAAAAAPRINDPAVVMSSSSTSPAQLSWSTTTTTPATTPPTLVEDATSSLPLIIQKVQKTSDADRSRDDMQEHGEVLEKGRTKINPNHKLLIEDNRASKKPPTSLPFSSGKNVCSAVDIEDAEVVESKNLNFTRLLQKPFSRDYVKAVVTAYGKAWVEQDSDQLVQLFTANGMYKEKPGRCMHGAEEIRHYWKKQICQNERDIEFQHILRKNVRTP